LQIFWDAIRRKLRQNIAETHKKKTEAETPFPSKYFLLPGIVLDNIALQR